MKRRRSRAGFSGLLQSFRNSPNNPDNAAEDQNNQLGVDGNTVIQQTYSPPVCAKIARTFNKPCTVNDVLFGVHKLIGVSVASGFIALT